MMRSMYSGVSGLKVHQLKMDVIGNNIANVNTVGYKKGQVTFQEVFSQVVKGAGAPQGGRGGTNPQQIGLGLKVGAINTVHTKGSTQRTDNPTDLMIDGEGFFIVSDDPNAENRYYTRAGNFALDKEGYLVTPDGYKVLGYKYDENGNWTSEITPIKINRSETVAPTTTKNIEIRDNLDSTAELPFKVIEDSTSPGTYKLVRDDEGVYVTDTIIKDSHGNSYTVKVEFMKAITVDGTSLNPADYKNDEFGSYATQPTIDWSSNKWIMNIKSIEGLPSGASFQISPTDEPQEITFDNNGELASGGNLTIEFTGSPDLPVGFGEYDETSGTYSNEISIDYTQLTQYANEFDAKPYAIEGNSAGSLDSFAIGANGVITGSFTNGEKKALGQIALAKFDNPMGLQKVGNNFFENTPNSGEPQVGKPANSGFGSINPGTLEMSNVDLSMEFTEMIKTQRGFQANSRVITTTDEMLQELVNMKR
ncbi:flagellar hook protein FlgE [Thermohalobacter berrensis]|uniref:Flagellar hook protein FlgE n=1 Tax=Thermohalobacter berrensis TaxID=99594 RepID=A0A419TAE4_9FIRM|nr:flagellar hook protein FlgE [Thermohalobacter berrensis]RKD34441.1 flagellar biosynthesis protein FlgE [Thermohalobacter berrensis]